jgi:hypothetical protein
MSIVNSQRTIKGCMEAESMKRSIKLLSKGASLADIGALLIKYKIPVTEVESISTGQPGDQSFYVSFKSVSSVEKICQSAPLEVNNRKFFLTCLGRQIVNVRVHWLPAFAPNTIVTNILSEYGKVVKVSDGTVEIEGVQVKSGVRNVMLEVSESQRLNVPHIIKFKCGSQILLTFPGRPSMCLRCHQLGHIRKDCPVDARGYAAAVSKNSDDDRSQMVLPAATDDQTISGPIAHVASDKVDDLETVDPLSSEGNNGVIPPVVVAEISATQPQEDNNLVEMDEKSSKREHSSSDDSESEEPHDKVDKGTDSHNQEISMTVYSKRELKRERLKKQKQNRHEQVTKNQRSESH